MVRIQASATESEQYSCSNSVQNSARELKVGPLNSILLPLQHEPNVILVP